MLALGAGGEGELGCPVESGAGICARSAAVARA